VSGWSGWNLTHVSPWVLQVTYADAYRDYGAMERALAAVRRTILHNVKAPDLNSSVAAEVCQFRRVGKGEHIRYPAKSSVGTVIVLLISFYFCVCHFCPPAHARAPLAVLACPQT